MKNQSLPAAVAALLAVAGTAAAQTVPFQAPQRWQIGSGVGQADLPKGGVFEPRIETAVQYVANIDLAADGEPQIDTAGFEAAPGFYASYSSGTARAAIDYSLIARWWEDSDFNDVSQRLGANGEWNVVPEWFSLRGQATYDDAVIDPRISANYGGLGIFGAGNLTELATASLSPLLRHRFSDFEGIAQYTYGRTWYLNEGKGQPVVGFVSNQDSTDEAINLSFGTAADLSANLLGSVFYDWQRSEYESALPYKYERLGIDGGVRVRRTLAIVARVGQESDLDANTTQGGLDSTFWDAGLRYSPNERTLAEARIGERFFGNTWLLSVTHRARILEFDASYSEEPTVETRTLSLGDFDPGNLPPGLPDVEVGRLNSTPYVARNARAGVRAAGSRTTLGLTGYQYERDYLQSVRQDETQTGVAFDATRQLASNLTADFGLSYNWYEYAADDLPGVSRSSDYRDTTATLRLNRRSGEKLTLSGEVGYLDRNSDGALITDLGTDYDGWWVGLRARWTP
jgi:hypothetical protein